MKMDVEGSFNYTILHKSNVSVVIQKGKYVRKIHLRPYVDEHFSREFENLLKLKGKTNVIPLVSFGRDYIDFPYFKKMLYDVMDIDFMDVKKCFYYLSEITNGLVCLHDEKIMHRDIKPCNIFLDDEDRPIIADFDWSVSFENRNRTLTYPTVTVPYRAPEIFFGNPYDEKIDVWALGCLAFELFNGGRDHILEFDYEYDQKNHKEEYKCQIEFFLAELMKFNVNNLCALHFIENEEIKKFLNFILEINPKSRPSIYQVQTYLSIEKENLKNDKFKTPSRICSPFFLFE